MASSIKMIKFSIVLIVMILGLWATQTTARTISESSMSEKHEQWMVRFGRVYKDNVEKEKRFKIFKDNVGFIEAFNKAENRPYKLGINAFADQTNDEFRAARNGLRMPSRKKSSEITSFKYENMTAVPSSMDWRKKGAVTPVKDQGQCGN